MVTDRQWRNLHKKLNNILEVVGYLERQLRKQTPKKWLKFEECIPPASVCKDVHSMLRGINTYGGFLGRLAEYYGCEEMDLRVDDKIEPKYRAVYNPVMKTAYSRKSTVDTKTVLHEWFHHLVNLNVVVVDKKDEEKYADKYANAFLTRAGADN